MSARLHHLPDLPDRLTTASVRPILTNSTRIEVAKSLDANLGSPVVIPRLPASIEFVVVSGSKCCCGLRETSTFLLLASLLRLDPLALDRMLHPILAASSLASDYALIHDCGGSRGDGRSQKALGQSLCGRKRVPMFATAYPRAVMTHAGGIVGSIPVKGIVFSRVFGEILVPSKGPRVANGQAQFGTGTPKSVVLPLY